MDSKVNMSYITLGGFVEVEKYKFLYFFIMLIVYIIVICSNATIICLIWMHQNLHEPMYIFTAALLCNSILFSTVIYPKMLLDFLSEMQVITYSACLFQCFLYYAFSGSEFILLAVMAYDRYVSICKPLQYPTIMRKSNIKRLLFFAWLFPAAQVSVPIALNAEKNDICNFTLNGMFCNNLVNKLYCTMSGIVTVYGTIVLLNVTIFPLLFIVFTYIKIFVITFRSCKKVRKKAAETCLPHLLVLINFSCLITYEIVIVRIQFNLSDTVRLIMTLQLAIYHPLFNPIIYGLKMKEISKHLKRLFINVMLKLFCNLLLQWSSTVMACSHSWKKRSIYSFSQIFRKKLILKV
ncbi:olfactory receptor-like protein COR2 [Boleophthalmus pectinirostris]|uniref:olfactory receptor-like protein COR2 n=1 Tax=Boleophthalmus pectinirostris TaxID=150288 RepID=UPI00242B1518|nr:olfactory receptor-like protein COR2 [Boleophthalmus pectinirostris]